MLVFLNLPFDVFVCICWFLAPFDLTKLGRTCKQLYRWTGNKSRAWQNVKFSKRVRLPMFMSNMTNREVWKFIYKTCLASDIFVSNTWKIIGKFYQIAENGQLEQLSFQRLCFNRRGLQYYLIDENAYLEPNISDPVLTERVAKAIRDLNKNVLDEFTLNSAAFFISLFNAFNGLHIAPTPFGISSIKVSTRPYGNENIPFFSWYVVQPADLPRFCAVGLQDCKRIKFNEVRWPANKWFPVYPQSMKQFYWHMFISVSGFDIELTPSCVFNQ